MTDLGIRILLGPQTHQSSAPFLIITNLISAHSGGSDYESSHHKSTAMVMCGHTTATSAFWFLCGPVLGTARELSRANYSLPQFYIPWLMKGKEFNRCQSSFFLFSSWKKEGTNLLCIGKFYLLEHVNEKRRLTQLVYQNRHRRACVVSLGWFIVRSWRGLGAPHLIFSARGPRPV